MTDLPGILSFHIKINHRQNQKLLPDESIFYRYDAVRRANQNHMENRIFQQDVLHSNLLQEIKQEKQTVTPSKISKKKQNKKPFKGKIIYCMGNCYILVSTM